MWTPALTDDEYRQLPESEREAAHARELLSVRTRARKLLENDDFAGFSASGLAGAHQLVHDLRVVAERADSDDAALLAVQADELAEKLNAAPRLCPSVDIDVDFAETEDMESFQGAFEAFLATVPGQVAAPAREPFVEAVEDGHSLYLRGTVWLAAFDEHLALAAQRHILAWADTHPHPVALHF